MNFYLKSGVYYIKKWQKFQESDKKKSDKNSKKVINTKKMKKIQNKKNTLNKWENQSKPKNIFRGGLILFYILSLCNYGLLPLIKHET